MAARIPAQEPEPALRETLRRHLCREETSRARVVVRFIKCSPRVSDKGNLYGGYKALLDQLRHCGLIDDDDPETIDEQISQIKVAKRTEAGTYVRIIWR